MTITNGTIKYGQTIKTGEYENKRGDIELSFKIAEGEDHDAVLEHVKHVAHQHLHSMLGAAAPTKIEKVPAKPAKSTKVPAPVQPAPKPAADPSGMEEVESERPPVPALATGTPVHAGIVEENLDDIMGGIEDDKEPAREITDKELNDATQKCQSQNKNGVAIRKILGDLGIKTPPGRIIDLPQEKRQTYLDRLKEVKPLA
jgi:hypothetical protein